MTDMWERAAAEVARITRLVNDSLEEACEDALQLGDRGVLMITLVDPLTLGAGELSTQWWVGPHREVPYGTITRMVLTSEEQVRRYLEEHPA
jgi:hypothetical protein